MIFICNTPSQIFPLIVLMYFQIKSSFFSRFKTWIWLRQFSFWKIFMHVILPKRIDWTNITSRLRQKKLNGPNSMSEPGFIAKVAKSQKVFSTSAHLLKRSKISSVHQLFCVFSLWQYGLWSFQTGGYKIRKKIA